MPEQARMRATQVLRSHCSGDVRATSQLLALVYEQLRSLAHSYMSREARDHTLQPTALVHEAFLRLIDGAGVDWRGKTHFFAVAAKQMRQVLIDHARARHAEKRAGARQKIELTEQMASIHEQPIELLALDEALTRLAKRSERQSRVAELRIFAGLQVSETALVLGVSDRTVKQDWRMARAWLSRALRRSGAAP